jgi:subtilase family serine protease
VARAALTAGLAALLGAGAMSVPVSSAAAPAPAGQGETVDVWLAGRQQAAQRFVDAVSQPGSSSYRRFLSPAAFTERFGPGSGQVNAVRSYLTGHGFTDVQVSVDDDYVSATAPASVGREFSVPGSLRADVLAVTGLESGQGDVARPEVAPDDGPAATAASARTCSSYWAQKTNAIRPAFEGVTRGAASVCGYSAKQVRAGYGLPRADTGRGKTIALIQIGAPADNRQALAAYAKANHLPAPRPGQYREVAVGQGGRNPQCNNLAIEEATEDSEAAFAMAPGADQLMVDGDDCEARTDGMQALFDALLVPLTGDGTGASAAVESVSYTLGNPGAPVSRQDLDAFHAIALRAGAEGVSMLFGSGDGPGVGAANATPAADADVTVVGGTTLGVGAHGRRLFESGWSDLASRSIVGGPWDGTGITDAAGGGVSPAYGEPRYQKGVVPVAMARLGQGRSGRAVPDIAADADPASGMLGQYVFSGGNGKTRHATHVLLGTSLSTPLVGAIIADADQGQATNLGFLNPRLYSLAGSGAYHDIVPLTRSDPGTDRVVFDPRPFTVHGKTAHALVLNGAQRIGGRRGTDQVTAPGYDTMTGLGTPNGRAFITALRSGSVHTREHHHG